MQTENDMTSGVLNLLAVILLLTALIIAARDSVRMIVTTYRIQSFLLAALTGITAWNKLYQGGAPRAGGGGFWLIVSVVALPLGLAVFIKPLLARATVERASRSITTEVKLMVVWFFRPLIVWLGPALGLRVVPGPGDEPRAAADGEPAPPPPSLAGLLRLSYGMDRDAERAWLLYKPSTRMESRYLLMFFVLVGGAFLLVFAVTSAPGGAGGGGRPFPASDQIGLVVSISLNLIGLYNMSIRQDLISQVVGLLIMDHGLFLAVVKIVQMPTPAGYFVVSLYLYTLITIFILVVLLPRLRSLTKSINLGVIAEDSRLKG